LAGTVPAAGPVHAPGSVFERSFPESTVASPFHNEAARMGGQEIDAAQEARSLGISTARAAIPMYYYYMPQNWFGRQSYGQFNSIGGGCANATSAALYGPGDSGPLLGIPSPNPFALMDCGSQFNSSGWIQHPTQLVPGGNKDALYGPMYTPSDSLQ